MGVFENRIFNKYQQMVGTMGGDIFNVYRPDYTTVDNTPRLVAQNLRFRCDPTGFRFSEPYFPGVSHYDIFGPRAVIQSGDILKIATQDNMTPPITVSTFFPLKAMIGFRSSQIGYIQYAPGEAVSGTDTLYTNVYFEFLNESYTGSPINKTMPESLKEPTIRAVVFTRPNVIALRTHLIQQFPNITATNPEGEVIPYVRRWLIEAIDQAGPEMILNLRNVG